MGFQEILLDTVLSWSLGPLSFLTWFHIIDCWLQFFYFFKKKPGDQIIRYQINRIFSSSLRILFFTLNHSLNGITSTYFIFIWKTYTTLPHKLKSTGFGLILLKNTNKSFKFPLHKIPFNQPKSSSDFIRSFQM